MIALLLLFLMRDLNAHYDRGSVMTIMARVNPPSVLSRRHCTMQAAQARIGHLLSTGLARQYRARGLASAVSPAAGQSRA